MKDHSIDNDWVPTEVHDWEGKERSVLVLNYTMACPLQCDFCCYNCHPKRKEKMEISLAERLIGEAVDIPHFSSVGFTGGEPLLFPDDMVYLAKKCDAAGLPFTMATAAHWAKTEDRAERILAPLVEHGLIRINISADPSHQAFIPRHSVINAARVASRLGVGTYIVGTFTDPDANMDLFLPELVDLPNAKMLTKYTAAVGRAEDADISQKTYGLNLELDHLSCYRRIHHDVVIWNDGTVYPCCSTFNRATPGIAVGNANDMSLADLWTLTEGSLLLRVMKRKGFARFYDIVRDIRPALADQLPSPQEAVGPCSLCHKMFKDPEMATSLKAVFAEYETRRIEGALSTIESRFGADVVTKLIKQSIQPNA